jgi:hypothetical protein
MTILDPKKLVEVGTAYDDRCVSGGRAVFGDDGYVYVLGDGRTYLAQSFARAAGEAVPKNCLLRMAKGATEFDPDYYYAITDLTGGPEAIGELETAQQGSGVGFVKMFHEDKLPEGTEPVGYDFWDMKVHKEWRLTLADPPSAEPIEGLPFSAIGFDASAVGGMLYTGESLDEGGTSQIYETDPTTNRAKRRFTMVGYFYGLYDLSK